MHVSFNNKKRKQVENIDGNSELVSLYASF